MSALSFELADLSIVVRAPLDEAKLRRTCAPLVQGWRDRVLADETADIDVTFIIDADLSPPWPRTRSFFEGTVHVGVDDDGWILVDDRTWATVRRDRSNVRVAIVVPETIAETDTRFLAWIAVILALREHGRFHLHAGLVEVSPGRGWLLVGASGAGKSTTALALSLTGLTALADDAVLLTSGARISPVSRPFHLYPAMLDALASGDAATRARIASLRSAAMPGRFGKLDVPVVSAVRPHVTPTALLLLAGAAAATTVHPLGAAATMGHLLEESAILAMTGATHVEPHLAALKALADRVPALVVSPGPDALADPQRMRHSIETALAALSGG